MNPELQRTVRRLLGVGYLSTAVICGVVWVLLYLLSRLGDTPQGSPPPPEWTSVAVVPAVAVVSLLALGILLLLRKQARWNLLAPTAGVVFAIIGFLTPRPGELAMYETALAWTLWLALLPALIIAVSRAISTKSDFAMLDTPEQPPAQRSAQLIRVVALQLAHPDVAVAHGYVVVLKAERQLRRVRGVGSHLAMRHAPDDLLVVVYDDAVEDDGDVSGLHQLVALELRRLPDDVVDVPVARLARWG